MAVNNSGGRRHGIEWGPGRDSSCDLVDATCGPFAESFPAGNADVIGFWEICDPQ